MLRWLLYYGLSVLIVIGLSAGTFYVLANNSDGLFAILIMYYVQYVLATIISLLQIATIIINYKSKYIKLKFIVSFTCVYSFIFIGLYTYFVRYEYQMKEIYTLLLEKEASPENIEAFNRSPVLGTHALFMIPVVLQIGLFILMYRKKQKSLVAIPNENIQ